LNQGTEEHSWNGSMVVSVFMKNKEKIRQIWKGKRVAKHAKTPKINALLVG